jgi:hypothetical protein
MSLGNWLVDLFVAGRRTPLGCAVVRWFWSAAWQRGERAARRDLAHGQYQDFASIDELLTTLRDDELADPTARRIASGLRHGRSTPR